MRFFCKIQILRYVHKVCLTAGEARCILLVYKLAYVMNTKHVEWVLRIAVFGEFLGHGSFALQGKKDWIGWFSNFGITDAVLAGQLLFIIGLIDIALAILILLRPVRLALLWMVFWGFWTALIRPLVGMPIWDFMERWANWGAPLALFLLRGRPASFRDWLK